MRTRLVILVMVAFTFTALPLAARPGNDPNAAVRYLNAIGTLPVIPEATLDKIEYLETIDQYKKLDTPIRATLREFWVKAAMRQLKLGAACPGCNFTPDDKQCHDDANPPYRRLRQLARIGRAYAWECEIAGDLNEAFAVLTSAFMLGQHIEDNGLVISMMLGGAVRKLSAQALIEFRARHPEPTWREQTLAFFKRIPRPSMNVLASLRYERVGIEKVFRDSKKKPEIFGELGLEVPGIASGSGSGPGSGSESGTGSNSPAGSGANLADDEKKQKTVKYMTDLATTPEDDRLVDGCMKLYDELLTIDPMAADYEKRLDVFQKKQAAAHNLFADNSIPGFKKTGEVATSLEKLIDQLVK